VEASTNPRMINTFSSDIVGMTEPRIPTCLLSRYYARFISGMQGFKQDAPLFLGKICHFPIHCRASSFV
jgi:hypothetical protein